MDNFYRAKRTDNGSWVYGIYLPLLDGACMIPDDAAICEMSKKVDGVDIKGHLIETVGIERNTLGLCTGVEDSEGMPVFAGDYVRFNVPVAKNRRQTTPARMTLCLLKKPMKASGWLPTVFLPLTQCSFWITCALTATALRLSAIFTITRNLPKRRATI